jgi:uncharacterized protein YbjT (DUF2867 family)
MKTAILAGATGLIGAQLLELLLNENVYSRVVALSRKPLLRTHPKLQNCVVDFDKLDQHLSELKGDDVYCCLGTTMKLAGSKEAFRRVDFDFPLALAHATHQQGARQFLLVTAMGADKNSSIFYNRVKGEVQDAIATIGFVSFHICQPSLLLGHRFEKRAGEGAGEWVMKGLDFLIPKKYKAIESLKVARSLVAFAKKDMAGRFIHHSGELQDY